LPTALEGIRVLDLTRVLAGPWATQLLADLGAEVIKVEKPGEGDDTRHWGPPYATGPDGKTREAAYFLAANRGKRSICVDMARPQGQRILRELAATSDVLVENFKVGALAKYGLDYASLRTQNSRLVYCSITGFGQDGPRASHPGYDFAIQGMSGLMSVTGEKQGESVKAGVALTDIITGLYASNAVLAALLRRGYSGVGQQIDIALLDSMVAALANQALNYLVSGRSPGRLGNAHPNIVPYATYTASDAPIIIAVGNDGQFRKLCAILGAPEIAGDARFVSNSARVSHREELGELLNRCLSKHPVAHWLPLFAAQSVPAGPINTIEQVFADPQVQARQLRLELPRDGIGNVPGVACPVRLSESPVRYERAPPALGDSTREVLRERLDMSDTELDALTVSGVIA
jgi:crotonobetainyl-CoA:carnitine CoA-transferase CaiB-like acyl-CoA transferase